MTSCVSNYKPTRTRAVSVSSCWALGGGQVNSGDFRSPSVKAAIAGSHSFSETSMKHDVGFVACVRTTGDQEQQGPRSRVQQAVSPRGPASPLSSHAHNLGSFCDILTFQAAVLQDTSSTLLDSQLMQQPFTVSGLPGSQKYNAATCPTADAACDS